MLLKLTPICSPNVSPRLVDRRPHLPRCPELFWLVLFAAPFVARPNLWICMMVAGKTEHRRRSAQDVLDSRMLEHGTSI